MISRGLAEPGSQQGLVGKDVTFGQDEGVFSLPALHLVHSNLVPYAVLLSPVLRQLLNFSFESFSLYTKSGPPVHQFFISVESCRVKLSSSLLFILVLNLQVCIEKLAVHWCTLIFPYLLCGKHGCQLRHKGVTLGFLQNKSKFHHAAWKLKQSTQGAAVPQCSFPQGLLFWARHF